MFPKPHTGGWTGCGNIIWATPPQENDTVSPGSGVRGTDTHPIPWKWGQGQRHSPYALEVASGVCKHTWDLWDSHVIPALVLNSTTHRHTDDPQG